MNTSISDSEKIAVIRENNGDVHVGDKFITNIFSFPKYPALLKEIREVEGDIGDLNPDRVEKIKEKKEKLESLLLKKGEFERHVIKLALSFTGLPDKSTRIKEAQRYFGEGNIKKLQEVLDENVMDTEYQSLKSGVNLLKAQLRARKSQLMQLSEEYLLKADASLFIEDEDERIKKYELLLQKSIKCYPNTKNYVKLGYLYFVYNAPAEALQYFLKAEQLIKESTPQKEKCNILELIGSTYSRLGNVEIAIPRLKTLVEYIDQHDILDAYETKAIALNNLASAFIINGSDDAGLATSQTLVQFAEAHLQYRPLKLAGIYKTNASILRVLGQFRSAISYFAKAIRTLRSIGDLVDIEYYKQIGSIYYLAGVTYSDVAEEHKALRCFKKGFLYAFYRFSRWGRSCSEDPAFQAFGISKFYFKQGMYRQSTKWISIAHYIVHAYMYELPANYVYIDSFIKEELEIKGVITDLPEYEAAKAFFLKATDEAILKYKMNDAQSIDINNFFD